MSMDLFRSVGLALAIPSLGDPQHDRKPVFRSMPFVHIPYGALLVMFFFLILVICVNLAGMTPPSPYAFPFFPAARGVGRVAVIGGGSFCSFGTWHYTALYCTVFLLTGGRYCGRILLGYCRGILSEDSIARYRTGQGKYSCNAIVTPRRKARKMKRVRSMTHFVTTVHIFSSSHAVPKSVSFNSPLATRSISHTTYHIQ